MGCWDETCALTNMSIASGDKVIGFITLDGQTLCLPIVGKYDDYGCIEEIVEDFNTEYVVSLFNEFLTDEECEAEFDDYAYQKDDVLTIEQVYKIVERGLSIKNPNTYLAEDFPRVTFQASMMLKDIYDDMTSMDYAPKLDEYVEAAKVYLDNKKRRNELMDHPLLKLENPTDEEKAELEPIKKELIECMKLGMNFSHQGPIIQDNPFSWMTTSYSDVYGPHVKYFLDYVGDLNDHEKELLIRFCEFGPLFYALRKEWNATAGKGSQQQNHEEIIKLAEATIKFAKAKIREYEEA